MHRLHPDRGREPVKTVYRYDAPIPHCTNSPTFRGIHRLHPIWPTAPQNMVQDPTVPGPLLYTCTMGLGSQREDCTLWHHIEVSRQTVHPVRGHGSVHPVRGCVLVGHGPCACLWVMVHVRAWYCACAGEDYGHPNGAWTSASGSWCTSGACMRAHATMSAVQSVHPVRGCACMRACARARACAWVRARGCVCVRVRACACVCMRVHACACGCMCR